MAEITQHPRKRSDIPWSSHVWTSNLFRLWEMIFWRRHGVQFSSCTRARTENGVTTEVHEFGTWEALFTHIEFAVRLFFRGMLPKFHFVRVPIPVVAYAGGYFGIDARGAYVFAIAYDNATSGSTSFSHTTAVGATLIFVGIVIDDPSGGATVTYAAASCTEFDSQDGGSARPGYRCYSRNNPSSGSNTVAVTTSEAVMVTYAVTYTGTETSGGITNVSQSNSNSSTTFTGSETVLTTNAWVAQLLGADNTPSSYSNGTQRISGGTSGVWDASYADSNGVVAGSYTIDGTLTAAQAYATSTFEIPAPAAPAAGAVVHPTLLLMGVG